MADETCSAIEDSDIVALLPVGPAVGGLGIDPAEDAFLDLPPPDPLKVEINPEPGGLNRRSGEICRIDEHLARNAANVEAGSTESTHLDNRDIEVVKPVVDDRVSGPGADNAKVEVPHAAIVPAVT
jgi:hypothetical protein